MPSRQDQLHSYQFMVQRVVAALVMRETDPAQSPFRRAAGATLASVLVAAIAVGAAGVYGALSGDAGTTWRDPKAVIVERESGARYVYFADDKKLHLVLNYASALLIIKSDQPKTILVSRKSIDGVPRGLPLGLAGAPDSLPDARRLSGEPWTVCSLPPAEGGPSAPRSALLVGAAATGGTALGDNAVLGRHPDGTLHLIWQNRRYPIRDANFVLGALAWRPEDAVPLAPAVLNALPAGADLDRVQIAEAGRPVPGIPEAKIGQVFLVESQGGGRQYAVARREGLATITQLQANLVLTVTGQRDPTSMSQGRYASLRKLTEVPTGDTAPPATPPKLTSPDRGALCGQVRDDGGVREIRVGATVPQLDDTSRTGARSSSGAVLADHIVVAPGRGAVVEAVAAPGAPGGTVSVITDQGRRYAVSSEAVLSMLGYGGVKRVRMPANLVALVPAGAVLDPEAARVPVPPA